MDSPVQTIKDKLDIVTFLKGYLELAPAGKNFKARCPFHNEKSPSFMVSPDRQSWRCFGCGVGGDVFSFIMKYENMEFGEALKVLAEKAGVELKRIQPQEYKAFGLLYELQEEAKNYFISQLLGAELTKKYLTERGLSKEIINEFEIGWAPNEPDGLVMHLIKKGYDVNDVVRAGLAIKTDRGMNLDRFRGRIMFPIHNHLGKVVGFTGRILPVFDNGEMGKYVNSPETAIFNKSKLLYGFWKTKNIIRETGRAFMVEGQMDFLMSYQAGVKNALATSGTALTIDHLLTIRRVAEELLLSFDNDDAGWVAGERAISMAESAGLVAKIVSLSGVKDPAELAQKDPVALKMAVERAEPAFAVLFKRHLPNGRIDASNLKEMRAMRELLGRINSISSPIERDYWLKELSSYTLLSESLVREEAEKVKPEISIERAAELVETEEKSAQKLSQIDRIIYALIGHAYAKSDYKSLADSLRYFNERYKKITELLESGKNYSEDKNTDEVINAIVLSASELPTEEFQLANLRLKEYFSKARRAEISREIMEQERLGNDKKVEELIKELKELN
jgi:DNA primase